MKVAESIANLIRDSDLTDGEIDYLMALLINRKHFRGEPREKMIDEMGTMEWA